MKKLVLILSVVAWMSCNSDQQNKEVSATSENNAAANAGQANVKDDASAKDIVKVAVSSPDHTTLVKALQQAELVDVLANPGPFTVFAPTNAAFDKLPAGTLDGLMKADKKA